MGRVIVALSKVCSGLIAYSALKWGLLGSALLLYLRRNTGASIDIFLPSTRPVCASKALTECVFFRTSSQSFGG